MENILNTQSNQFLNGEDLIILGHIDFDDVMKKADSLNQKTKDDIEYLRKLVEFVDVRVCEVVKAIVAAGKIPIIIGGGHNNAYPALKGAAKGLYKAELLQLAQLNCINLDTHTDYRAAEGRHSGNAFRYADEDGFLNKYFVLGIHLRA